VRKPLKIVLAIVLVAIAGAIAWQILRTREPSYQGRSLGSWLTAYYPVTQKTSATERARKAEEMRKAHEAVRQIGTDALPTLLRMLQVRDSALKVKFMNLAQRQHLIRIRYVPAEFLNNAAASGFPVLGQRAKNAVPALIELANRNISPASRLGAISALGSIGPPAKEAVPLLLPSATNTDIWVRYRTIVALGSIRSEPERVVPVLMNALHDPNENVQNAAVQQLGWFGPDAKLAVPTLVEFINAPNSDWVDKMNATNALKNIDPEAAAKAGVK
jgi:hypothetical protein